MLGLCHRQRHRQRRSTDFWPYYAFSNSIFGVLAISFGNKKLHSDQMSQRSQVSWFSKEGRKVGMRVGSIMSHSDQMSRDHLKGWST